MGANINFFGEIIMETRFSLDQPMELSKFMSISRKACDDYANYIHKTSTLKKQAESFIHTEQHKVLEIILQKAKIMHTVMAIIFFSICGVLHIFFTFYKILYLMINSIQYPLISEILRVIRITIDFPQNQTISNIIFVIVVALLMTVPPVIWLIYLFVGENGVAKIISGILLCISNFFTVGTIVALIVYLFSLLNSEERLRKIIQKRKKYKRMLSHAEKRDDDATERYQAQASLELEKAKQNTGEYEWLFLEWKRALDPIINDIRAEQRKSPDLKYMTNTDRVENVKFMIGNGPLGIGDGDNFGYGIYCGNFETPRKYISCNVEINKEMFRRVCVMHYEQKLQQSRNSMNNYFN